MIKIPFVRAELVFNFKGKKSTQLLLQQLRFYVSTRVNRTRDQETRVIVKDNYAVNDGKRNDFDGFGNTSRLIMR